MTSSTSIFSGRQWQKTYRCLNTRTLSKVRKVAISDDAGATFSPFADDPVLIHVG
jgi:hypothetical protein